MADSFRDEILNKEVLELLPCWLSEMLGAFFNTVNTVLNALKSEWICFSALQKFEVTFCLKHNPSIFFYN